MDPFTEKDLIECLKSIAVSLRNIDTKMDDMTQSMRELVACQMNEQSSNEIQDEPLEN